jgi:hypothetical protein
MQQQPGQATESAAVQPKIDEEHDKDQRAAAESEVAAHDAAAGAAPPWKRRLSRHRRPARLRLASSGWR